MSGAHALPAALPRRRLVAGRWTPLRRGGRLITGLLRAVMQLLCWPLAGALLLLGASLLRPPWLAVRDITLRGCALSRPAELLAALPWEAGGREALLPAVFQPPDTSHFPWVRHLALRPAGLRSVMVEVEERLPIARAQLGGARFWICDDGALVAIDRQRDAGLVPLLKDVPLIELPGEGGPAPEVLLALAEAAVACRLDAAGQITGLRFTPAGEVELSHACGMRIRMGGVVGLGGRMAALPKVLRSCADERAELRGINAGDPCVFYKEWRSAPPQVSP